LNPRCDGTCEALDELRERKEQVKYSPAAIPAGVNPTIAKVVGTATTAPTITAGIDHITFYWGVRWVLVRAESVSHS
jgi:hypothetical protein